MLEDLNPFSPDLLWVISAALTIAFILAFSVGANDVSNSFGTSVGSRVLTVTQACILATIFESAGATLLGYSVCNTFRTDMYDVSLYDGAQRELMLGALSCLIGSAAWNMVATALKMPISGTHSIVGATVGFSIVLRGWGSVKWWRILRIVLSWFASPLLSGLISSLIYTVISKTIICQLDPLENGLKALPLFYGVTVFINVASVAIDGPGGFPWYVGMFIALLFAGIAICCVALMLAPKLKREILHHRLLNRDVSSSTNRGLGSPFNYDNQTFEPDTGALPRKNSGIIKPAQQKSQKQNATTSDELNLDPKKLSNDDNVPTDEKKSGSPQLAPKKSRRTVNRQSSSKTEKDQSAIDKENLCSGEEQSAPTDSQEQSSKKEPSTSVDKPSVAPKSVFLVRQMAKEASCDTAIDKPAKQFVEIDLTLEESSAGQTELAGKAHKRCQTAATPVQSAANFKPPGGEPAPILCGERFEIVKLFSSLQILTACFAAFAHGTNDVSNAVAPLIPIWNIYTTGKEDPAQDTEIWILFFGSIGICAGLWAWGRAVMGTISDGLTKITPSKGFSVELGAAISVLMATKLGLPISTTHCKVGSLVIVGFVSQKFLHRDRFLESAVVTRLQSWSGASQQLDIVDKPDTNEENAVDWKMFRNIAITWVSTVPLAALASVTVMWTLKALLLENH